MTFDAAGWLQLISLGGLMGMLGQGVRTIVGLKKLNDAASGQTADGTAISVGDLIEVHRLIISLAIGFVAGAIAAITTNVTMKLDQIASTQLMGWMAAGYAGADFIEGFMARAMPATGVASGSSAVGTATSAASATTAAASDAAG